MLNAGVGGMLYHNVEGSGKLRDFSFDLYGPKVIKLVNQSSNKWFSYFGLGASVNQKSLNWDKLVFADQLDAVTGISGVSIPGLAQPGTRRLTRTDSHGEVWRDGCRC